MTNSRVRRRLALILLPALLTGCDDDEVTGPSQNVTYQQVDRFGLPAINTVFISSADKQTFNTGAPANDRSAWKPDVVAVLMAFGQSSAAASGLADALLPDVQPVNTSQPTQFLNGRAPADDVIDGELGLIFGANASLNSDHVDGNDRPFLPTFPYLGEPFIQ